MLLPPSGLWSDFNTSPSTRGFKLRVWPFELDQISIPAPPRGASTSENEEVRSFNFNTSPSTRGFLVALEQSVPLVFQYQPLHEGLPAAIRQRRIDVHISIPAPPRGASRTRTQRSSRTRFQYQPLHEGLRRFSDSFRAYRDFNTSPSTRGFRSRPPSVCTTGFQYQPLHEGLQSLRSGSCTRV